MSLDSMDAAPISSSIKSVFVARRLNTVQLMNRSNSFFVHFLVQIDPTNPIRKRKPNPKRDQKHHRMVLRTTTKSFK